MFDVAARAGRRYCWWWRPGLVGRLLAVSLVLAGLAACSGEEDRVQVDVESGRESVARLGDVEVRLPSGATEADEMTVELAEAPGAEEGLEHISRVGSAVQVELSGVKEHAQLAKPAVIRFRADLPEETVPIVMWESASGGWEALPTSMSEDGEWVEAKARHFSGGFLGALDVKAMAAEVKDFVVGRSGLKQPTCPNESQVRDAGVQVASSSGDRVKWCLGRDDDGLLLRVGSDLRVFTQLTYPKAWRVEDNHVFSISPDAGLRSLASLMPAPRGHTVRVIDGGDTLTLRIPEGSSGKLTAEMSIAAWALEGALFGAGVFSTVAKAGGGKVAKEAKSRVDKLRRVLGGESGDKHTDAVVECLQDVPSLTDADSVKDGLVDALEFGASCGSEYVKAATDSIANIFLAGVISTVAAATSVVLTAAHLLITGARELWDSVASFGGSDSTMYRIVVKQPATGGRSSEDHEFPERVAQNFIDAINRGDREGAIEWGAEDVTDGFLSEREDGGWVLSRTEADECSYEEGSAEGPNGVTYLCPFTRSDGVDTWSENYLYVAGTYQALGVIGAETATYPED